MYLCSKESEFDRDFACEKFGLQKNYHTEYKISQHINMTH